MDDVDVIIQQHFTVILVKAAVIRHGLLQTVGAINIDQRAQRDPRQKPEGVNVAAVNRPRADDGGIECCHVTSGYVRAFASICAFTHSSAALKAWA